LSAEKLILLVQDNAGWHRSQNLQVLDGIVPEFLPAYSPELQPAERLWSLVDEPREHLTFAMSTNTQKSIPDRQRV
jgi:hypothetical protein